MLHAAAGRLFHLVGPDAVLTMELGAPAPVACRGRYFAWGFVNVDGAQIVVQDAPQPGAYSAAFRGFEGKPLPPELGGHKKRYVCVGACNHYSCTSRSCLLRRL